MKAYSDPERENDPHALPDIEIFELTDSDFDENGDPHEPGWYWWSCLPGCLPDGDPIGPFTSQAEALADAQDKN